MEEGFGLLKSGFVKANIADEQIACILQIIYLHYMFLIN